jgi:hypothetical protein
MAFAWEENEMGLYVRTDSQPILSITRELYAEQSTPCQQVTYRYQEWHLGTGLPLAEHPAWDSDYRIDCCQGCQSKEVLMIAHQWCVSHHSGDEYYDYELLCQKCGTFTAVSFSEN